MYERNVLQERVQFGGLQFHVRGESVRVDTENERGLFQVWQTDFRQYSAVTEPVYTGLKKLSAATIQIPRQFARPNRSRTDKSICFHDVASDSFMSHGASLRQSPFQSVSSCLKQQKIVLNLKSRISQRQQFAQRALRVCPKQVTHVRVRIGSER